MRTTIGALTGAVSVTRFAFTSRVKPVVSASDRVATTVRSDGSIGACESATDVAPPMPMARRPFSTGTIELDPLHDAARTELAPHDHGVAVSRNGSVAEVAPAFQTTLAVAASRRTALLLLLVLWILPPERLTRSGR